MSAQQNSQTTSPCWPSSSLEGPLSDPGRADDQDDLIANTLDCPAEEVAVVTNDIPASWCMEGGIVLPDPGTPEEAEWKKHDQVRGDPNG